MCGKEGGRSVGGEGSCKLIGPGQEGWAGWSTNATSAIQNFSNTKVKDIEIQKKKKIVIQEKDKKRGTLLVFLGFVEKGK